MIYFAKSHYSKIIFFLGIVSLLITTIKYFSLKIFIVQSIIFYIFMSNTDCNIYGKCYLSVYIYFLIAIIVTLFLIFDYFGIFNNYKRIVRRLYSYYDSSNSSNLKQIIFTDDTQVTDYYKKRQIPKIINKNFRHTTIDEELDENDKKTINKNNIYLLNNKINNSNSDNLLLNNDINKYIGLGV